jgi:L-2-hydroxyglutarate oxidase LhgO
MVPDRAEILIAGAGIIGLTIARELVAAGRGDIVIIEKEAGLGKHASGRNSGVLHAGVYYAPDTMKATSCLAGNKLMRAFCKERGLPLHLGGKVIVAGTEAEVPALEELYRRATMNGASVAFVDEKELAEIEPMARTTRKALLSRDTAVVDPKAVLEALRLELEASGRVKLVTDCAFHGLASPDVAETSQGKIRFGRFVNAAGAYCDVVARPWGLGAHYRLIPFKGIYRKLVKGGKYPVNGNIYPVPDVRNPFLGVHFTRSAGGDVYLGPTAIPALGRENYGLLSGVDSEALRILTEDAVLFFVNPKFRQLALIEPRKYVPAFFHADAAKLVKSYDPKLFESSHKVGIRPQLVDWRTKELVMDFLVEAKDASVHVLNPISPAFTASMAVAQRVVAEHFA